MTPRPHPAAALAAGLMLIAAPAMAAPSVWRVDPAGSKLSFTGQMSGEAFSGVFKRWTAQIAFDPKDLAHSSANVTIETGSAVTGDSDRDEAMPTADWFASQAMPKASFATHAFKELGGGRYQAIGDLTIRGVKKAVVLPFTLAIAGDTAKMTGQVQLNRTDFGIGQGKWKTGDVVAIPVNVNVALTAHRVH
jgi:polyisoprenoid-binding protein YceI